MKLKGFSRYDFFVEDYILVCQNIRGKRLKTFRYNKKMCYYLTDDNGKKYLMTPQRIMYCIDTMSNPEDIKRRHIRGSEVNPILVPLDRKTKKKYYK